jgi:DNA-binding PadR family transcriptional regulator
METLTAEMTVLLALADGPASGAEISARVRSRSRAGAREISPGTLYPALARLRGRGLVRTWAEGERARVGRPQRFNELTPSGVGELLRQRDALRSLTAPSGGRRPGPALVRRLRANLRRAFGLSSFASRLRSGVALRPGGTP